MNTFHRTSSRVHINTASEFPRAALSNTSKPAFRERKSC